MLSVGMLQLVCTHRQHFVRLSLHGVFELLVELLVELPG